MLNDVHFTPRPKDPVPHHRGHHGVPQGVADVNTQRVRERLPHCVPGNVPEAIYGEPEDRGDAFNTVMSASIVVIVVALVVGLSWSVFL